MLKQYLQNPLRDETGILAFNSFCLVYKLSKESQMMNNDQQWVKI
jgi:hypothetical protein